MRRKRVGGRRPARRAPSGAGGRGERSAGAATASTRFRHPGGQAPRRFGDGARRRRVPTSGASGGGFDIGARSAAVPTAGAVRRRAPAAGGSAVGRGFGGPERGREHDRAGSRGPCPGFGRLCGRGRGVGGIAGLGARPGHGKGALDGRERGPDPFGADHGQARDRRRARSGGRGAPRLPCGRPCGRRVRSRAGGTGETAGRRRCRRRAGAGPPPPRRA